MSLVGLKRPLICGFSSWALEDLNLRPLPCQGKKRSLLTCTFAGQSLIRRLTSHRSSVKFGRLLDQMLTIWEGGW
jgi:hypothetical protein